MVWANFGTFLTVDVAYYQGNYWPDGNVYGVIVNTARGNQGSFQVTSFGQQQVNNARAAGKAVGYYFFNGNLDAYTCGVLFARNAMWGFNAATDVIGIDCEDEGATNTHAWGPAECAAFVNGIASVNRSVSWKNILIYMNYTVNRRFNWADPVSYGSSLWYARPGHDVDQAYWPTVTMKQDGLYNGVDADGHNVTYPQIIGEKPSIKKRRKTLVNLFAVDDWNGTVLAVASGTIHIVTAAEYPGLKAVLYNSLDDANVAHINSADLPNVLSGFGLSEYSAAQVQAAGPGKELIATWADSRKAPTTSVDADALASSVSSQVVPAVIAAIPHEFVINGKASA